MAKRHGALSSTRKRRGTHKTKKRLETKWRMLAERKAKKSGNRTAK